MCLAILIMPMMNSMAKALTVDYPLFMVVGAGGGSFRLDGNRILARPGLAFVQNRQA